MNSTKKKIKYGKTEIPPDALETKNAKFRVTMFIDLDVLDKIRKRASKKRLPYQTFINQLLRSAVLGKEEEQYIRKIVQEEIARISA